MTKVLLSVVCFFTLIVLASVILKWMLVEENNKTGVIWHNKEKGDLCIYNDLLPLIEEFRNNCFVFPLGYDDPIVQNTKIDKLKPRQKDKVFIIKKPDELVAKNLLWANLLNFYGDEANKLVPKTFRLYESKEIEQLQQYSGLIIIKKNKQRQTGIKILYVSKPSKDYIDSLFKEGYVVAQELLQRPFLVNGKKINLRVYLVIANNQFYVFNDGFIYYAPVDFLPGMTSLGVNITSGYVNRTLYEDNPLTHKDLADYLTKNGYNASDAFLDMLLLMQKVAKAFQDHSIIGGINRYQIFGCDLALEVEDSKLVWYLIEVNKGPDLSSKDKRDKELKTLLFKETHKLAAYNNSNHFIRIL